MARARAEEGRDLSAHSEVSQPEAHILLEEESGNTRVDRRWHGREVETAAEVCRSEQQTFSPTAEESQGQTHRSGKVLVPGRAPFPSSPRHATHTASESALNCR